MTVIAIDPGTRESGVVIWDGSEILFAIKESNHKLIYRVRNHWNNFNKCSLVIEQIRSYGQTVGQEIFDTCVWCGRFEEAWFSSEGKETTYIPRVEVKKHICHRHIATDSHIRQALIDRFGPKPTKKKDNPVYGGYKLAKDEWQAFALAVTYFDNEASK